MLLPIMLLLASAGPAQQALHAASTTRQFSLSDQDRPRQFSLTEQNRRSIAKPRIYRFVSPGSMGFVQRTPRNGISGDEGIVVSRNPCLADDTCRPVCASIRAHVFSDGENPQPLYVTDCPNLDVPYRTERAHRNGPE